VRRFSRFEEQVSFLYLTSTDFHSLYNEQTISSLKTDIAKQDRPLQAIRADLGSPPSDNLALQQEVAAQKKALLGRSWSRFIGISFNNTYHISAWYRQSNQSSYEHLQLRR
jgi:hypothetical protein